MNRKTAVEKKSRFPHLESAYCPISRFHEWCQRELPVVASMPIGQEQAVTEQATTEGATARFDSAVFAAEAVLAASEFAVWN
jgi:hypothetical protein